MVDGHETERRVYDRIDDRQIQPITLRYGLPIVDGGTAKRIHANTDACGTNGIEIDNVCKIVNIGCNQVPLVDISCGNRLPERQTLHPFTTAAKNRISPVLYPASDVGVSRASVWGIVFKAAIFRRIV
jgi:hypothetical protein